MDFVEYGSKNSDLTVVLLHGYGADMNDLAPLHREIRTSKKIRWLFLNAPQSVIFDSSFSGRAWFEIDVLELSLLMQKGDFDRFTKAQPLGLSAARDQLLDFVTNQDLDPTRTVFGGFSQGAMVATDLAFHLQEKPKGLLLFSGSLVNGDEWKVLAAQKKGMPFFQSHGTRDPLLRIEIARKLCGLLQNAGLRGKLVEFDGAHEIPGPVVAGAAQFLEGLIP